MKDVEISKTKKFFNKKAWLILLILVVIYVIVFLSFCAWKYQNFKYDGLDLAIYNQVFFNSVNGDLFEFTIHPHSYLGDHVELFIVFLLPFYYVFKSPLTLLALQTVFLALCAWPLALIAKNIFKKNWAMLLAGGWFLISPFIQNINTFEFHLLPFALFVIFWLFYFFQKNNYVGFLIAIFFALTIREDVALIIIGIGLLAFFAKGKNKIKWAIIPIIISIVWFYVSYKITGYYSGYDQYKFFVYYSWLGETPLEFIKNLIIRPDLVLPHIFSLKNLNFVLIFLISFAFLPIFRIKYLLPSILIWAQYFLSTSGNEIIYRTHYSALLLPFLFIASLYGLQSIVKKRGRVTKFIKRNHIVFVPIFIAIVLYALFTLGPIIPLLKTMICEPARATMEKEIKNDLISQIPADASIITAYDLLPKLSSREKAYSLYYTFTGLKQLSEEKYITPADIEYALIDFEDLIEYQVQMENVDKEEAYLLGDDNLRNFIKQRNFRIIELRDKYALLKANTEGEKFYQLEKSSFAAPLTSVSRIEINDQTIKVELSFQPQEKIKENYQLQLVAEDDSGEVYTTLYPLAYGLYPTTEWQTSWLVKTNYNFEIPAEFSIDKHQFKLYLIEIESGNLGITNINSIEATDLKIKRLEPAIELN